MVIRLTIALLAALLWGITWALFLQRVELGRYLAARRTWMTVVIGVGADLAIALVCTPWAHWWPVVAIVSASAIGIVTRSILNEWSENRELTRLLGKGQANGNQDAAGEQDDLGAG